MNNRETVYRYETHIHTFPESACAMSEGREYIRAYLEAGYTGLIITNHFYRGNSGINRHLNWKEWVKQFCRGYEKTYEEGLKQGLDIFFGWEETLDDGDDYLIYGLDKEWLLNHPECRYWSRFDQYHETHAAGGCVVQAHPFREAYYLDQITLSPFLVDAVEVLNGGNLPSANAYAYRYAQKIAKPMTAGTDMHNARGFHAQNSCGIYMKQKMKTISDYVHALRAGTVQIIPPPSQQIMSDSAALSTPVFVITEEGNVVPEYQSPIAVD
ncbi:MAG: PHP domain-containing protein [Treponema sp.]|jgi:hypothetical protein|nr:PHP domain-containing protein [Treponema sp.]